MAGAQTTLTLQDRLTGPLMKMMRAMDSTIRVMERMDSAASNIDTRGLQRARRDFQSASADLERLRSSSNVPDRLGDGFNRIRSPVNSASNAVRNFFASFVGAAGAYLSIQGLSNGFKKFVEASDSYTSTSARLNLINDGLQTQAELQDKIYNAAQRSLTPYNDMANSVAKLNLLAGHAFSGNDESIRFSELMGKAFAVSGADTGERKAAMHQLTQAMASGRLQGDEYVSIIENAPLLANAIEKAMGQGQGSLKKLSSDGKITADVIKNALFGAGAEIEGMFSELPITFGDAMTQMKNWATTAFEPLLVRFNQFVNSDAFAVLAGHAMWFINIFIGGMSAVFSVLEWFYEKVAGVGQFFENNWAKISPMLILMGTILSTIVGILIVKYAWLGLVRVATLAMAAAMWVVNKAYLASPITWLLIGIIVLIALVINNMINWADQTAAVVGVIAGAIYWLGAAFYNVLMGIGNFTIATVEWFVNTWNQGTYAVQMGFIGFNITVWSILDAIGNASLAIAEWFVNMWNQGIFMVQMAWIGFIITVRMILDAIGNAALGAAEWFINTWNGAVFGVQTGFHKMGTFVTTLMGGIASGVVGMANAALGAISDLINGAAGKLNSLIDLVNNIPGVEIGHVGTVDLKVGSGISNFAANIGKSLEAPVRAANVSLGRMNTAGDYTSNITMPTAPGKSNLGTLDNAFRYANNVEEPSAPVKKSYDRLGYAGLGNAYVKGEATGSALSLKASDKLSGVLENVTGFFISGKENPLIAGNIPTGDLASANNPLGGGSDKLGKAEKPAGGKGGANPTGGKLDSIGKIDNEINIAEEDLKMLRELADIKSIQNVVTLTPKIEFNGDMNLKEEADIDKITKAIEKSMKDEVRRGCTRDVWHLPKRRQ